jgi:hypothetical protein
MLRPRADEIVNSILYSFEEFVVPELEEPYAVSVGHTIRNLLRHVALRIELEPPALYAGNEEMRAVLSDIAAYASSSEAAALADVPADIATSLAAAEPQTSYPSLSTLSAHAIILRGVLDRTIRALQAARPELGSDPTYLELRGRIRADLARQLEREAAWTTPAFSGIRR